MNICQECERQQTKTDHMGLFKHFRIAQDQTLLLQIAPAMDVIQFCPSDPCHSEYSGISKIAHKLLVTAILTPSGQAAYYSELC